jgi:SHS2 domain-containing protein
MKRYEFIEHTADIIVKAYGDSLEEAFAAAATALFDILTGEAPREKREKVTFEVTSVDREGLLVGFLSRLIALHEIERLVFADFEVSFVDTTKLKAEAWGEKFSDAKHGGGLNVKAVSYHMMEIFEGQGQQPSYVQVLFDV